MGAAGDERERKREGKGDLYKGGHFSRHWGLWLEREEKAEEQG